MKKYFLIPLFFLFWIVSALFRDPWELIPIVGAAAILCMISLPRRRAVWLSAAASVSVCVSIFYVQFLLRCVPALLLVLAHGMAASDARSGKKKGSSRPEGVYTAVIVVSMIALAALISDIVSAAQIPRVNAPGRFYWAFSGVVLFFAVCLAAGGRAAAAPKSKTAANGRSARRAFGPIWICGGVCSLTAAVGCLINGAADVYCAVFSWLIFLAVSVGAVDPVLSDACVRLRGAAEKLLFVPE